MTDTTDPPGNEDPDFTPTMRPVRRSPLTAGTVGCMAGAGIGAAGAVLFSFLLMGGSNVTFAALVSIVAALAAGAAAYRRLHRQDPPVAVGLLIGLAIVGLLAGMCTAQLG